MYGEHLAAETVKVLTKIRQFFARPAQQDATICNTIAALRCLRLLLFSYGVAFLGGISLCGLWG